MNIVFDRRRAFTDTPAAPAADGHLQLVLDPIEQLALADRADWTLLRLVICAACAILLLGTTCSLLA